MTLQELESAVRLFHPRPECVAVYPAPTLSPYQEIAPSLSVVRDEIRTLGMLPHNEVELLIVPSRALFAGFPDLRSLPSGPSSSRWARISTFTISFVVYWKMDIRARISSVRSASLRSEGILDLFAPNSDRPVRVELFGDTVETIRHFDVETQRSDEPLQKFSIEPATQFPLTQALRSSLARRLTIDFNDPHFKRDLAEKIERISEQARSRNGELHPRLHSDVVVSRITCSPVDLPGPSPWWMAMT